MNFEDRLRSLEEELLSLEDVQDRLNGLLPIIDQSVRYIINESISNILRGTEEFRFGFLVKSATDFISEYVDYEITDGDLRFSVDRASITRDLNKEFVLWKKGIETFRKTLNSGKGVDKRFPIRNSNYVRYLAIYGKGGTSKIVFDKFIHSDKSPGFLLVLLHGNKGVDWSGVEYGGISLFNFSGVDFISLVERYLNSHSRTSSIKSVIKRLTEKVVFLNKVEKTRFIERLIKDIERESLLLLEKAAEYVASGKSPDNVFISLDNKIYQIIRTKTGKLGLRYSLKHNKRSRRWRTK